MTPMLGDEYKSAIAELKMTQREAADFLGVSNRTSHRYAHDGAPPSVAMLLRVMLRLGLAQADVT